MEQGLSINGSTGTRMFVKTILADDVYFHLKAQIMEHAIEADTQLKIEVLARELGVSPTPVREAILRLESESLVTKRGTRGYYTNAEISLEQFEDLWDFRLLVEPWAADRAAKRATDADIVALRSEIEHPAGAGQDMDFSTYRAMQEHDQRFHDLLMRISGNVSTREAYERSHVHVRTFRIRYASQLGDMGVDEHVAIVDAIAARDVDGSRRAMVDHLVRSRERLRPFVQG